MELFSSRIEETRLPSHQVILKYKCEMYSTQTLTPPQCKIINASCTLNQRLAFQVGQWSIVSIFRDSRICHFSSYNAIENEARFVLKCPMYKPIKDKVPSLFHHSRELDGLKSSCYSLWVPLAFPTLWNLKSFSFHLNVKSETQNGCLPTQLYSTMQFCIANQ